MKVVFITELLKESGMGHYTRCHSIADAFWERNVQPEFILASDVDKYERNENYIYNEIDWIGSPDSIKLFLNSSILFFFDSYHLNDNHFSIIYKEIDNPVFLDDENKTDYLKGVVINGNIIADTLNYATKEDVSYLLGQKFQSLRKEFWENGKRNTKEKIENILISLGGTDNAIFVSELLKKISKNFPEIKSHVISTISAPNDNCNIYSGLSSKQMADLMKTCDIAISAAGQTTYELAATQTPGILVKLAENQSLNVEGWVRNGFFEFAGNINDPETILNILSFIKNYTEIERRECKTIKFRENFITTGSKNIVVQLLKKLTETQLTLRPVQSYDLLNIFELSNDDEVRRLSFNSDKIDLETHTKWFNAKLSSLSTVYFIAEFYCEFAGQVRYEINGKEAVVGISISKNFRGLSLGDKILAKSAKLLYEKHNEILKIIAYIKQENVVSQKSFEKAGYVLIEKGNDEQNAMKYEFTFNT